MIMYLIIRVRLRVWNELRSRESNLHIPMLVTGFFLFLLNLCVGRIIYSIRSNLDILRRNGGVMCEARLYYLIHFLKHDTLG